MAEESTPEQPEAAPSYLNDNEREFLNELGEMVADHHVRLERLEEKEADPPKPRDWIARHRTVQDWEELADWVDWLNTSYSMPMNHWVPKCWPSHPGLVHVLAGLRSAWRAAVIQDEKSKEHGNAVAAFHDYHLYPFFNRLTTSLFSCQDGTHMDEEPAPSTERARFPEDLVEAAEPEEEVMSENAPDGGEDPGPEDGDDEWWKDEA